MMHDFRLMQTLKRAASPLISRLEFGPLRRIRRRAGRTGGRSLCLLLLLPCSLTLRADSRATQKGSSSAQVESLYETGMHLVHQRRLDAAIRVFEQGTRIDPRNLVLLNALGAAYSLGHNTQQAEEYFLKVLNINPQFVPARKNLAITYFNSGKYDLATAQFEELSRSVTNRPVAFLFLGMIAGRKGEYRGAVDLFQSSGNLAFAYPDSILYLAQSLYKLNRENESRLVLSKLDNVPDVSARHWFEAGRLYCSLDRYEEASEEFDKARKLDPALPNLDYLRAYVLSKMGRSDDALEILQHLTAREPDPDPLNLLGHLAQDAGDVQLSLEAFEKALEVAPDSEQNYLDYSTLCMGYGNTALGLEIVKRGLERIPHSYRLTVQEGAFLASLGRPQEAERAFQSAVRLQDDNKEALLGLAVVQASSDHFNEALATYAEGVKRFPNDFNLNFYYAFALFRSAQTQGVQHETAEKVRSVIARAIQLNPQSGSAYYLRAKYYTVMDPNPGLAMENLESCLRLEPRYVPAKYQLALLYRRTGKRQESENLLEQVREVQAEELKKEQDHPRIVINRGAPIILGKELP